MAKHPVPKKKTSKGRTQRRFKSFQNRVRVQLSEQIRVDLCSNCKAPVRLHRACEACGYYRGKKVLTLSQSEEVTTLKAK